MITVKEALARILSDVTPLDGEDILVSDALGRTLREPVKANRTQPPSDMSAMDGYAVRADDLDKTPVTLPLQGHVPAGHAADFILGPGRAARIFTGGALPEGADTVVIQENTKAPGTGGSGGNGGDRVTIMKAPEKGANVRLQGFDFSRGGVLKSAGIVLQAKDLALIAAANVARVRVSVRPEVAFISTGDELVPLGAEASPWQIINSNGPLMAGLILERGGAPRDLGIAPDEPEALKALLREASGADCILTLGGVSVGEHDIVKPCLAELGFKQDFWKVAIKPGKPVMFGQLDGVPLLALPGNPVSAFVCAILFLFPLLDALQGRNSRGLAEKTARLRVPMPKNGPRQAYLRAGLENLAEGMAIYPLMTQDSSALLSLAEASALLIRLPNAPAAGPGERVKYLEI